MIHKLGEWYIKFLLFCLCAAWATFLILAAIVR